MSLIKTAKDYCTEHGHRLTDSRAAVLRIVSKAKKPLGAYDILEALRAYMDNPKPPTAYRAIEFWQAHGFIHRIESLNAYVACHAGHRHDGSQYLVCDNCGDVQEIHLCSVPEALKKQAGTHNFTLKRWSTELHGLCTRCSD
jgi:Fur family zinc uptake transcriptional regulator